MKKISFLSFLALLVLALVSCQKEQVSLEETADFDCQSYPDACALTAANGNFAIDIFKKIESEEPQTKNIFISPFSISTALAMTVNGTHNQTYNGMMNTLRLSGMELPKVNTAYKLLLETLPKLDNDTKLKIANSIWHQLDFPVIPAFLNTGITYYLSEIFGVDFKSSSTLGKINIWVDNKTEGLIKKTLDSIDPDTRLMLINAIYFKGLWRVRFDPKNTQKANFSTPKGIVEVDMMHLPQADFLYFQNDLLQAVELPYGDSIFSMSILLPRQGKQLSDVVQALNEENLQRWHSGMSKERVELYMPKFKLEYDKKLKSTLSDMGMGHAFSDAADFTKMVQGGGVKIGDVIHKAFVEVNEQGTEAAAVTVVVIVVTSLPQYPVINLNRPFLFVIWDNKTNSILFVGKIVNPVP
jgi:serpin B